MSVPAFLSGRVYRNEVPMRRFVLEVNRGKTIFNRLFDRAYETHLVERALYQRKPAFPGIPDRRPYGGRSGKS